MPNHQSASCPMPVTQHLSMAPTNDASQCALNSISEKCNDGYRSATPPPMSSQISCDGTMGLYTACVIMRFDADSSVIGWLTCLACSMTTLSVVDAGSSTFTPPACVWTTASNP